MLSVPWSRVGVSPRPKAAGIAAESLLLAGGMLALAWIASGFRYYPSGPPMMMPQLGLAFAILLLRGADRWPGALLGALLESFVVGDHVLTHPALILLSAAGITLGLLIGVQVVRRGDVGLNPLASPGRLPQVLGAMMIMAPVIATFPHLLAASLELGQLPDITLNVAAHMLGNSLGLSLFGPLFLSVGLYVNRADSGLEPAASVPVFVLIALMSVLAREWQALGDAELALAISVLLVPMVLLNVHLAGLFGGSMSIIFMSLGTVTGHMGSIHSSQGFEFWSTIILQVFLLTSTVVVLIFYAVQREGRDSLMELNHRVRNNLLLIIGLVRMQASGMEQGEQAVEDLENRLILMSAVHNVQHERGRGSSGFAPIMAELEGRMQGWPPLRGCGWDVHMGTEEATLAVLMLNEVATGSKRARGERPLTFDLERRGEEMLMTMTLDREEPILSLSDPELMHLAKVVARYPRIRIDLDGSALTVSVPAASPFHDGRPREGAG